MAIDPAHVINSRLSLSLASFTGQLAPTWLGYGIARRIADQIATRREWKLVRAVRANQWVVSDRELEGEALESAVSKTFENIARSVYDLYHFITDARAIRRLVELDEAAEFLLGYKDGFGERGAMVAGVHLCGGDLVIQALSRLGFKAMWLTLPELRGGYRDQYEMRRRSGMEVLAPSFGVLRRAVKHLRAGGIVVTGIDRPVPVSGQRPQFFGRPAPLPMHYIHLAMQAQVPVTVMAPMLLPSGRYRVTMREPLEVQPAAAHGSALRGAAEAVLKVAESVIREVPQQWAMTLPVWPEALQEMPQGGGRRESGAVRP